MSETPRTDRLIAMRASDAQEFGAAHQTMVELIDHARQLERELAQARADALEEAAQVCDTVMIGKNWAYAIAEVCHELATAIRALRSGGGT